MPVVHINGKQLFPHQYLPLLLRSRGWSLKQRNSHSVVKHNGTVLHLTTTKAGALVWEWSYWKRTYLPPFSLQEKTVLDIGAGSGETAYFFFEHGASKVVAVESSEEDVKFLRENARRHDWNIEIIEQPFSLSHLKEPFDFMKMDIEGGERLLLDLDKIDFPCVLEAHTVDLAHAFRSLFDMKVSHQLRNRPIYTLNNFHKFDSAQ